MKKPTLTLDELSARLCTVATELAELAEFDLDDADVQECVDVANFAAEFFSFGTASPAPSRGRGACLCVPVGWVWWPARMDPGRGAATTALKIARIPGVESVGQPKLDPQFGLIWQLDVVIRSTQ